MRNCNENIALVMYRMSYISSLVFTIYCDNIAYMPKRYNQLAMLITDRECVYIVRGLKCSIADSLSICNDKDTTGITYIILIKHI